MFCCTVVVNLFEGFLKIVVQNMASMSAAKKKQVSQNELRLLMLKQKLQTQRVKKKIESPLAKYPFNFVTIFHRLMDLCVRYSNYHIITYCRIISKCNSCIQCILPFAVLSSIYYYLLFSPSRIYHKIRNTEYYLSYIR